MLNVIFGKWEPPPPAAACYPRSPPTTPSPPPQLNSLSSSYLDQGRGVLRIVFWQKFPKTLFLGQIYEVQKDSLGIFVEIDVQKHGTLFFKNLRKVSCKFWNFDLDN